MLARLLMHLWIGLAGRHAPGGIHAAHRLDQHPGARTLLVGRHQIGQHLARGHRRNAANFWGGHAVSPAGLRVARALRALGFHGADCGQRWTKQEGGTGTTRYIIP